MSNNNENSGNMDFFNFLGNLAELGKEENTPMDVLFEAAESPEAAGKRKAEQYLNGGGRGLDPMSRRNDISPYASAPYPQYQQQPNNNQRYSDAGNPYTYNYGYTSDPVPSYNGNRGYSSYPQQQQNTNTYFGSRRNTGNDIQYRNGTTSASYGMSGTVGYGQYDSTPQNPYVDSSRPYDARDYEFSDNDTFGGRGGYGW